MNQPKISIIIKEGLQILTVAECKITAGQKTFSRQNHNLLGHIYICMEKLSGSNFNLANSKPKAKATKTVDLKPIIQ